MAQSNQPQPLFRLPPVGYQLQLPVLVRNLLPTLLRRPRLLALLAALTTPLEEVYRAFIVYFFRVQTELSYSGQTLSFERALNDRFDAAFRRIRIVNSDAQTEPLYLYFSAESRPPVYFTFEREGPPWRYAYTAQELASQVGFVVRVPATLRPQQPALRARIGQFKLATIRYRIQYV
ncbi:hypothetical protein SAMN02745146_0107 [Hymenobacter daecheongensis DSM 21074]|uniref:Uncharacterized protein n=1 Tax=Hymenobacter daecheongensis DSM 21074 TaxID=1121955 RepID=A0A1M6LYW6_9BACT|nr:hypothetical protein [Hymenobacter daecheongensis]SHJ76381.1 hypothetical protein SAMN02745146_0107 [Hymenobacter daecheongensis DSM 21074]